MRAWVVGSLLGLLASLPAHGARVKDLGAFYGVRDNQLSGAGLVVGLQRTGDSPRNEAAIRTLANRLQGLGVSLALDEIGSRNVALVMVTSTLGPDARQGSRLDAVVASTGDASSLEGGVLLLAPLLGTDGQVHAVAEGPLVVGGYRVSAAGSGARKNTTTVGRVPAGAVVEVEVPAALDYAALTEIDYIVREPDFTTATRIAAAVDEAFGGSVAQARSASTVALTIPEDLRGQFPLFAAQVEAVEVEVDTAARVVVNERTGTVVMGADVRVSPVAVAHGGLTIEVRRADAVSQPAPLSGGVTVQVGRSEVRAGEQEGQLLMVEGVQIGELVAALNDLGVRPRDLVAILQAIRSSGALHAEVVSL